MKHLDEIELSPDERLVVAAIVRYWGGHTAMCECERTGDVIRFRAVDDMIYTVTMPDSASTYFEDDGRPFEGRTRPDAFLVRAVGSAPDDFFYVTTTGIYEGFSEKRNLLPDKQVTLTSTNDLRW